MKPTDLLRQQHVVILNVCDCLNVIATQASEKGELDTELAEMAAEFFRTYLFGTHFVLEESKLVPLLEVYEVLEGYENTAAMYRDHAAICRTLGRIDDTIFEIKSGKRTSVSFLNEFVCSLEVLLRAHIDEEDNILFPAVDTSLCAETHAQLLEKFRLILFRDDGKAIQQSLGLARALCEQQSSLKVRYAELGFEESC